MGSARDAVDISSDEEDFRRLSAGPLGWVSKLFDNTVVIDESPPQPKKMSKSAGAGEDGDGDDCVVLERDPDGPVAVAGEKRAAADAASDEVEIVAVKGQIAYKETKWKTLRKASKFKSLAASHPEREPNVLYRTVSSPRHQGYDEDYTSEDYTSDDEEEYFELADEEEYFEEDDEATVYVGNLPHATDSEYLAQLFKQAGTVESSEIIYNRETGQSRRFGFITMSTVEQAEKAVDIFHCGDLDGRLLAVKKAATPRTSRVYVGNLPWYVDDSRLKRLFSEYGDVVDAEVVYHYRRGAWRSQGFGFVTMVRREEAENAIWNLDGQDWRGRELRVEAAKDERPRRGS